MDSQPIPVRVCQTRRAFLTALPKVMTGSAITVFLATLSAGPALADKEPAPEQLLSALRNGGYVLYIRHAHTDRSRDDALQPDLKDCSTQRLLSHEGERQADELGIVLVELGVPVGQVFCSPFCRAVETARRLLPRHKATEIVELGRLARVTVNKVPACNAKLRELLSRQPPVGENTVIVGHYENLTAIGGPDLDESGWAVFRPEKDAYRLVARFNPKQWRELVRVTRARPKEPG
jgi:phosphohistidine phosphatase SixA